MDQRNKVIILGTVGFLILAIVLVSLFYFLKFSKSGNIQSVNIPNSLAKLPSVAVTPFDSSGPWPSTTNTVSPTTTSTTTNVPAIPVNGSNVKTFQGQGFSLSYPNGWGILTCGNSKNIELDPYNNADLKNYACDQAIKPITVIINNGSLSCSGDTVKIGNNTVIKSKTETANWLKNRWCVNKNGMSFDITNRINSAGITGTGKDDFSKEVEKIITSITTSR